MDALESENFALCEALLMPALDQFPELPALWFHAGNLFFATDRLAMSMMAYEKAIELEPVAPAYGNLGAVYRRMELRDKALETLAYSVDLDPDNEMTLNNLAACYVNEGAPDLGLKYADEAIKLRPEFSRAGWNKALCLLELGRFAEGFDLYRQGLGKDRIVREYKRPDGSAIDYLPADIPVAGKLLVYGEQGIGDELMFSTMLWDLADHCEIVFDCHPRLYEIYASAAVPATLSPTRKDEAGPALALLADVDYAVSIGDLAAHCRRHRDDFTGAWKRWAPFYEPDHEEVQGYRVLLEGLAEGRKIIGLATRGGVIKTNRNYRTLEPKQLEPILTNDRYMFVSLDYENMESTMEHINTHYGPDKIYQFFGVNHHFNYARTQALVAATDALVTVCQSVFHLSAAMNHRTLCLVPDKPAWRYGLWGKKSFWYPSNNVRLFRKLPDKPWDDVIAKVAGSLKELR
jgi:tetratricopeptide (TPR) repeat protein